MSPRCRRAAAWIVAGWLLATLPPAAHADGPVVLPGYDLFTTLSNTRIGVDLDGPGPERQAMMVFASEPLSRFDFGSGPVEVGGADSIVRRYDTATPGDGLGAVELVALQLRSTEPVGYYATLQSDRGRNPLDPPDGLPSTGTIDIRFDPAGQGGTFHVEFLVNYDIRYGSPAGPIVATGSTPIQGDDRWQNAMPASGLAIVQCHDARGPLPLHQHCVVSSPSETVVCDDVVGAIPMIAGVNHLLDGVSTASDFFPGHTAESESCGTGGGQTCELAASNERDLTGSPDAYSGYLRGGPFASATATALELTCTVQVNAGTHNGPDAATATASGSGVVVLPPTQVAFVATPGSSIYVCTRLSIDGTTHYYDSGTGTFSLLSSVNC